MRFFFTSLLSIWFFSIFRTFLREGNLLFIFVKEGVNSIYQNTLFYYAYSIVLFTVDEIRSSFSPSQLLIYCMVLIVILLVLLCTKSNSHKIASKPWFYGTVDVCIEQNVLKWAQQERNKYTWKGQYFYSSQIELLVCDPTNTLDMDFNSLSKKSLTTPKTIELSNKNASFKRMKLILINQIIHLFVLPILSQNNI